MLVIHISSEGGSKGWAVIWNRTMSSSHRCYRWKNISSSLIILSYLYYAIIHYEWHIKWRDIFLFKFFSISKLIFLDVFWFTYVFCIPFNAHIISHKVFSISFTEFRRILMSSMAMTENGKIAAFPVETEECISMCIVNCIHSGVFQSL